MQLDRTAMIGVGGLLAGAVLSYAVGASNRAGLEAQLREQGEIVAGFAALDGRMTEMQEGMAALAGSLEAVAAAQQDGSVQLFERVEALGGTLSAAVGGLSDEVSGALSQDLAGLADGLAALADKAVPAGTVVAAAAPAPAATGEDAASATVPGAGETLRIGQTLIAGDGALRAFLMRADAAGGIADVAVGGLERSRLTLGKPLEAGDCTLTLTGFAPGGATLQADCGGSGGGAAQAAATPAGDGVPLGIGETALYADGALRVFLAAKDEAAGTARVAVNGLTPARLSVGEAVAADGCAMLLTGFADGRALIAGDCGGAATGKGSTAEGTGAGTALVIGGAASFADGAVRVFLSAVDPEAGTARVAINGIEPTRLAMGEPVEAGDCTAVLTGASANGATIDVTC